MIRRLTAVAFASLLAFPLLAQETALNGYLFGTPPYHMNPDRSLLRLNGTLTPDVGPGDDIGLGVELAAGLPLYALDTLAVSVGHMDADKSDMTTIGLFAEETYKVGLPIMPYAAAGIGYAWVQQTNATENEPDETSMTVEVEAGIKIRPCSYATVHAGVEMDWADREVYPSTDGLEDKQWRFVAGVTWLY